MGGTALVGWAPLAVSLYSDKPPVAHTGGFDEPSCHSCHFDLPLNDPAGELELSGVPTRYEPGETYGIVVRLTRPELAAGGFQLAARHAAGSATGHLAGSLRATDDRAAVTRGGARGIEYAHHVRQGTVPSAPGTALWHLEWTAPEGAAHPVVFHAAGNAANGDQSEFGDYIYLRESRSEAGATAVRKNR